MSTVLAAFSPVPGIASQGKINEQSLQPQLATEICVAAAAICPPVLERRKFKGLWCDVAQEGPGKHGVHHNFCSNLFPVNDRSSVLAFILSGTSHPQT